VLSFLEKAFGLGPENAAKKLLPINVQIDNFGPSLLGKSDAELVQRISELRGHLNDPSWDQKKLQKALDDVLPEVFAIVREASGRVLGMRHFPMQMLGGITLHQGKIAEMRTGEGKTLVATLPTILNSLSGRGVHVITVNDYLARRDSEWMGRLYKFLGLSVGLIVPQQPQFEKVAAYQADITYCTNNELGFDYLRDNMADSIERQVRRGFNYAIIDEVDSVLIDEARTPLIISGMPESTKQEIYQVMAQLAPRLTKGKDKEDPNGDYYVDEKARNVILTDKGIHSGERALGVDDLWSIESNLAHHLLQALKAKELFRLDSEYVVQANPESKKKEIVIVDEFTGRLMYGRRWSDGLHQAVEAKERVPIQDETLTHASITFQNFFRLYPKLSGMTGTAVTEAEEFKNIYNLPVVPIPTHRQNIRKDLNDQVYKNQEQKFYAIVEEIIEVHKTGRPVLVGTTSIEKSELVANMLSKPQEMVKLLTKRSERLEQLLKAQSPVPVDLIKDLGRLMDKPLNIKFELAFSTFKAALHDRNLASKVRASIETVIENSAKQLPGADSDLVSFIETFLRSCEVVEEIRKGINHNILNAKHHEKEAQIIAQAGRLNAITIATNMAGRGTDILLGGNAEFLAKEKIAPKKLEPGSMEFEAALNEAIEDLKAGIEAEHKKVVELGGLHVIGTERHESRRIDNQLRGRAARQGDPGATHFYLSLDDSLMRIFGGERLTSAMDMLKAEEDLAIEAKLVNSGIENAQRRVEAHNYEIRKRLLEYDDVQDTQRKVIYQERQRILTGCSLKETFLEMLQERIDSIIYTYLDPEKPSEFWLEKVKPDGVDDEEVNWDELPSQLDLLIGNLCAEFPQLEHNPEITVAKLSELSFAELVETIMEAAKQAFEEKEEELTSAVMEEAQRQVFLESIDQHWVDHLQALDSLKEGIHLRGYGNKQPLIEYKTEALALFDQLINSIRRQAIIWIFHIQAVKVPNEKKTVTVTG
jgi:preprotein translocase subunit SecA